jgi:[CysO sulfur-carrier protein]-S-L-cysteine hydrolase
MMQTIYLTMRQIEELTKIANYALPNESCAFLIGKDDRVVKVLPMRNADSSPVTFSMEPDDILYAYNLAESEELDIIAIFHSHPGKAFPSKTDRKFMELNPVVWLIYSTTDGGLNAFIYDDMIKEVGIKTATMG